jgi:hypothetical protein
MVRYEFDPLVRNFAEAKVADFMDESEAAERRLETSYLDLGGWCKSMSAASPWRALTCVTGLR